MRNPWRCAAHNEKTSQSLYKKRSEKERARKRLCFAASAQMGPDTMGPRRREEARECYLVDRQQRDRLRGLRPVTIAAHLEAFTGDLPVFGYLPKNRISR